VIERWAGGQGGGGGVGIRLACPARVTAWLPFERSLSVAPGDAFQVLQTLLKVPRTWDHGTRTHAPSFISP
jgi:hypothetical protein